MKPILNFDSLMHHLLGQAGPRRRVAVAFPHDSHTLEAVEAALGEGFADFVLVGRARELNSLEMVRSHPDRITVEHCADADTAAHQAVSLVRQGCADVLMKGLLNTDNLLRAVLDKEHGLLPRGAVLSHITAAEIPGRDRLLFFSDAAVIPFPTLEQRSAQLAEMAATIRAFGIERPRIALIHCSEKTSPKFPVTIDYAALRQRAAEGAFGPAVVDGPMDVKSACDAEAAAIKGIASEVCGSADALLMPDIEAGNVFYKAITTFAGALNAGMLMGTTAPVVLPSRSDSTRSKLCSLAMACLKSGR